MNRNVLLIPFVAVLALLLVGFASAANLANNVEVTLNELDLGAGITAVGKVGDVVPVRVTFEADKDATDVKVKVRMEGHREEVSSSTDRFDIVQGGTYTELFKLEWPSENDVLSEEFVIYVEVVNSLDRTEESYTVRLQRESYTLEVQSVDFPSNVAAGDVFPITVVAKNNGFNDADDTYVIASIPALGASTRGFLGDLVAIEDDNNGEDDEDAAARTVYLRVPENAQAGVYEMELTVYNDDAETTVTRLVSVGSSASTMLIATDKNKELRAGETTMYELIIVNSADNVRVFNVNTVSGSNLVVSAPSAVAVGPDATETVSISVTPASDAEEGTYTFSVEVEGQQTVYSAQVTEGGSNVSGSLVAWTVVLVIVFIVLLAVLLVLVTRKEQPVEEVETSYY